ncbi:MAG: HAD family phosphatase [Acidobacteria bacterium]|nr:HAD family phosphatase [Acidobacteriota bacterium]
MSDRAAPPLRALVFDIGRVIVRVNITRALGTLGAGAGLPPAQVWSAIQSDPCWRDWQEGRITPRDWRAHLSSRLGFALTFEEFCAAWNSALDPKPILGEDLFTELGARYRLVLLSNTDPLHVAHLEENFSFPRHFPARVYSCAVGASKPDPIIYRRAIEEAGAPAEQILYIDDTADYVEAGGRTGLQGILFEGPGQLVGELRRRGILQPVASS